MSKIPKREILMKEFNKSMDTFLVMYPSITEEDLLKTCMQFLAGLYECSVEEVKSSIFH